MPPPMHMVTTAHLALRRRPSIRRWPAKPGAGHAIGVAQGDGPAIDIEPLAGDAQPVAAIEQLDGKGLVQLPEIDVLDLQPMPAQQLRHGEDRSDPHFVGLAAGDGEAAKESERLQATPLRILEPS